MITKILGGELRKIKIRFLYFLALVFILQSCGTNKLVTENKNLKLRIAELENRIYELTDSPDQLAEDLIEDVDLLMTIPYSDNLEYAQSLIQSFKSSYPKNKYIPELIEKERKIKDILDSSIHQKSKFGRSEDKNVSQTSDLKVQFSVHVSERNLGFTNVQLSIQNLSNIPLNNIWIKGTLVDKNGESYGITQDFFFNRLNSYEHDNETLTWEYVQLENIKGIMLQQMRYSSNRQIKMFTKDECIIDQGNVKIFLEF